MRGGLLAALLCLAASFASPTGALAAAAPAASEATTSPASGALSEPSALVVFVSPAPVPGESPSDATERELSSIGGLSTGIMSASQGTYTAAQLALDITQGARISSSSYRQSGPPALTLVTPQNPPGGGRIEPWSAVLRRAETAPQLLEPGLLASQIPGGVAYAGMGGADSAMAATRNGRVAAVSQGPPATLLARISRLRAHPSDGGRRSTWWRSRQRGPKDTRLDTSSRSAARRDSASAGRSRPGASLGCRRRARQRWADPDLADHERAWPGCFNRRRPHDPRPSRRGRTARHAGQGDPAGRPL